MYIGAGSGSSVHFELFSKSSLGVSLNWRPKSKHRQYIFTDGAPTIYSPENIRQNSTINNYIFLVSSFFLMAKQQWAAKGGPSRLVLPPSIPYQISLERNKFLNPTHRQSLPKTQIKPQKTLKKNPQMPVLDNSSQCLKYLQNTKTDASPEDSWTIFTKIDSAGENSRLQKADWKKLINKVAESYQLGRTLSILKAMKRSGNDPDANIYAALVKSSAQKPKQMLMIHDFVFKQTAIDEQRMLINSEYLMLLLTYLLNNKLEKEMREIWKDLTSIKLRIDTQVLLLFLDGFSKIADEASVIKINALLNLRKESEVWTPIIYERIMNSYFSVGNHQKVIYYYHRLCMSELPPTNATYPIILASLSVIGELVQTHMIGKAMMKREIPFDTTSLLILIDCARKTGNLTRLLDLHQYLWYNYENVAWNSVYVALIQGYAIANERLNMLRTLSQYQLIREIKHTGVSTNEMADAFLDVTDSTRKELDGFRNWNPSELPAKALSVVVSFYAGRRQAEKVKEFFGSHVFLKDALKLRWARAIRKQFNLLHQDVSSNKAIPTVIDFREHEKIKFKVGVDGPFAFIYRGMVDAWTSSLDRLKNDEIYGFEVAKMNELILELEELETRTVKETGLFQYMKTPKDIHRK